MRVGLGQVPLDKAAIAFCACLPVSAVRLATKASSPGTALPAGEWETVQLRGCWRAGQTAGGSRNFASYPCNPCLPFSVPEGSGPRYIRITLHQHCRLNDSQLHPIGFHIFQVSQVPGEASCCDTGAGFCHLSLLVQLTGFKKDSLGSSQSPYLLGLSGAAPLALKPDQGTHLVKFELEKWEEGGNMLEVQGHRLQIP